MSARSNFAALVGAACLLAAPVGSNSTASDGDGWRQLAGARAELRLASPMEARFTQTFVPSGFASGDVESGSLYIDLPRCLRFEYLDPFPKDFLLCGDWVYTWNPGEVSGRRFLANAGEAEGLDILRLETEALESRYRASLVEDSESRLVIELAPTDSAAEIQSARLEFRTEPGSTRLSSLSYEDRSGNRTRFEIDSYRQLENRSHFDPPTLDWLED